MFIKKIRRCLRAHLKLEYYHLFSIYPTLPFISLLSLILVQFALRFPTTRAGDHEFYSKTTVTKSF